MASSKSETGKGYYMKNQVELRKEELVFTISQ